MRATRDAPRTRRAGSRRRRLAPNAPAPDLRVLATKADASDEDLTERVQIERLQLIEFEWHGGHGVQPVILRAKTLLD